MVTTFENSYINDDKYNKWRYNVTTYYGCVPDNQPLESHNRITKGSQDDQGIIKMRRSMNNCISQELVSLIETYSVIRVGPVFHEPLLDEELAFQDSKFMEFYNVFDADVDLLQYKDGWLLNGLKHLNTDITTEDVNRMELSLKGELIVGVDKRDDVVSATKRFHYVHLPSSGNINNVYRCTCKRYYATKRCYQSMYIQHRHVLSLKGQSFSGNRRHKKLSKYQIFRNDLMVAKKRKQEREFSARARETDGSLLFVTQEEGDIE